MRDVVAATGATPDCILLNSVTQCFPDTRYLAAVVLDAIDTVAPGGTVIVGDIRHSSQLHDFARWAEMAKNPNADPNTLGDRVDRRAASDSELSVDPSTLASIAGASDREVSVFTYAKSCATIPNSPDIGSMRCSLSMSTPCPEAAHRR